MKPNLVMIRHGQSVFNSENRFAGWVDTDLTSEGERQAKVAGETLSKSGFVPDIIYISPFTRTKRTAQIIFGHNDFIEDARLVERFYGDLSGKNKEETLKQVGDDMFLQIRRGYETQPPAIQPDNREIKNVTDVFNRFIKGSFTEVLPPTESLKDVEARVRPFVDAVLIPALKSGKKVMIVAHGNSLRALIKIIKQVDAAGIAKVELETAQPAGFVVDISGSNVKVLSDSLGKHFAEVY
jgi:2,3-bisphosphoglycerate-dependent phosphoglycerate mutase